MKLWGDTALPVDRSQKEGPPPCCAVAVVASDELVCCDALSPAMLAALLMHRPDWATIPADQLYLCGSCRQVMFSYKILTREAWCRSHGADPAVVASAWVHDEEFWGRGLTSAPDEVKTQPWWPAYVQAAHTPNDVDATGKELPGSSRAKFRGRVQLACRMFPSVLTEEVSLAPTGATQAVAIGAVAETPPDPLAGIDLTTPDVSIKP